MKNQIKLGQNVFLALIVLFILSNCKKEETDTFPDQTGTDDQNTKDSTACEGLTSIFYHGDEYKIVQIGNQCWFAENLRTDKYRNGDPILQKEDWLYANEGLYTWYVNDSSYNEKYGKLYNNVRNTNKECPEGWHVPSDDEWIEMITHLDSLTIIQSDQWGDLPNISEVAGGKLKSVGNLEDGSGNWELPNLGATNESGFSGEPGGKRNIGGGHAGLNSYGNWWSSTESHAFYAWYYTLNSYDETVIRRYMKKNSGASIRCVKD